MLKITNNRNQMLFASLVPGMIFHPLGSDICTAYMKIYETERVIATGDGLRDKEIAVANAVDLQTGSLVVFPWDLNVQQFPEAALQL